MRSLSVTASRLHLSRKRAEVYVMRIGRHQTFSLAPQARGSTLGGGGVSTNSLPTELAETPPPPSGICAAKKKWWDQGKSASSRSCCNFEIFTPFFNERARAS
jgi:hypothetical protein